MGYVNVKDFINSLEQKPEDYDFNGQSGVKWAENEYVIDQYFIDRATGLVNKSSDPAFTQPLLKCLKHPELLNYDCDGSQGECDEKCRLIHEIYGELWGWEKNKKTFGCVQPDIFGFQFGGDTMNSVQTILDTYIQECIKNEYADLNGLYEYAKGCCSLNYCFELYSRCTTLSEKKNRERFLEMLNSNSLLCNYISEYHTLGNFCLVPSGFNGERGYRKNRNKYFVLSTEYGSVEREPVYYCNISDYWDRSLFHLQKYGYAKLKKDQFTRFINYFFLWDYAPSGKVKPYSYENISEKKGGYEFTGFNGDYFFSEAVKRIKRRGIFMVAMLRLQQNIGEEEYKKIRQKVFATDAVYNGYEDVFKIIKEILSENQFNSSGLCEAQNKIDAIKGV